MVRPRVLIVQQPAADGGLLDDVAIRDSLSHLGLGRGRSRSGCTIQRIPPGGLQSQERLGCDLAIWDFRREDQVSQDLLRGQLPQHVPLIVLVDEADRAWAEATWDGAGVDVIVRSDQAGRQLHNSLRRAALQSSQFLTDQELARAEQVQRAMLPGTPPHVPGLDIAARCRPASVVGGDFYDFVQTEDQDLRLVLGDVTGHGLNAALRMAETQAYFRAFLRCPLSRQASPSDIMQRVNELLLGSCSEPPLLATAMIVSLCPQSRQLTWASAGHQGYIMRADGEVEPLTSTGPVLGCVEQVDYTTAHTRQLQPGDSLLLVTDGIVESCDPSVQLYGRERMLAWIRDRADQPAAETLRHLFEDAHRFRAGADQQDDMTAVLVRSRSLGTPA